MRILKAFSMGLLLAGAVQAEGMSIGDKAPPIDIAHWVKGEPVTTFAPGHTYVIEFWATW